MCLFVRLRPNPTHFPFISGITLAACVVVFAGCNADTSDGDPPVPPSIEPDIPAPDPGLGGGNEAQLEQVTPSAVSSRGGTLVTLTASGFEEDFTLSLPTVVVGGLAPEEVNALSANELAVRIPALPQGTVSIEVSGVSVSAAHDDFGILAPVGAGEVIVNESLPNPGGRDANRDGDQSNTRDEFVELVNLRPTVADLSGYRLSDSAQVRHLFGDGSTIPPGGSLVVFGAGDPSQSDPAFAPPHASGHAQVSSNGSLSLNNGGDVITLSDPQGDVIDVFSFAGALAGVSINRDPDGVADAPLADHDLLSGAIADVVSGGHFSPGMRIAQTPW